MAESIEELTDKVFNKIDKFIEKQISGDAAYTLISGVDHHLFTGKTVFDVLQYMRDIATEFIDDTVVEEKDDELHDRNGEIVTPKDIFEVFQDHGYARIHIDYGINWEQPVYLNVAKNYYVIDLTRPIAFNSSEPEGKMLLSDR